MRLNARAGVGGSAHPSEHLDVVAAFLSNNASAGRPHRGPGRMGGVSRLTGITAAGLNGSVYLQSIRTRYIRIDLVIAEMNQPEAMTPVLHAITNTLTGGHHVWVVGSMPIARGSMRHLGQLRCRPGRRRCPPEGGEDRIYLVEPTGHNAPAGSRAARKGRNNCYAWAGKPFRRRFNRTIHRLQAWYRNDPTGYRGAVTSHVRCERVCSICSQEVSQGCQRYGLRKG